MLVVIEVASAVTIPDEANISPNTTNRNFFMSFFLELNNIVFAKSARFVSKNEDGSSVIEEFGKHTLQEHGIDYSEEALMQFIIRKRV